MGVAQWGGTLFSCPYGSIVGLCRAAGGLIFTQINCAFPSYLGRDVGMPRPHNAMVINVLSPFG